MSSIFIAILSFILTFILQLLLLRILRFVHVHVFVSFVLYIVGFVFLMLNSNILLTELNYTSLLIYILLTFLLITFSFVPLLHLEIPSSMIVKLVHRNGKMKLSDLRQAFNDEKLILARLNDLVQVGIVQKRGKYYVASQKGLFLARIISLGCSVMGLKVQG